MSWCSHDKPCTVRAIICPSCGYHLEFQDQDGGVEDLPGLPAGVKFDPNDHEIMDHLEAKVLRKVGKLHPLIDGFIPTLEGENGICYTHPEKLPGVSKDGLTRHFFHRPSKAYMTGSRKRRKVAGGAVGVGETRWHKTGKTRAVWDGSGKVVKGFKMILVLYANYGRRRKPEKTNWVMHEYHLGHRDQQGDADFVLSKVFYQTQPRQCTAPAAAAPTTNRESDHDTPQGGGGGGGAVLWRPDECISDPHLLLPELVSRDEGHGTFVAEGMKQIGGRPLWKYMDWRGIGGSCVKLDASHHAYIRRPCGASCNHKIQAKRPPLYLCLRGPEVLHV